MTLGLIIACIGAGFVLGVIIDRIWLAMWMSD